MSPLPTGLGKEFASETEGEWGHTHYVREVRAGRILIHGFHKTG